MIYLDIKLLSKDWMSSWIVPGIQTRMINHPILLKTCKVYMEICTFVYSLARSRSIYSLDIYHLQTVKYSCTLFESHHIHVWTRQTHDLAQSIRMSYRYTSILLCCRMCIYVKTSVLVIMQNLTFEVVIQYQSGLTMLTLWTRCCCFFTCKLV